jgi:protein SCO1/2
VNEELGDRPGEKPEDDDPEPMQHVSPPIRARRRSAREPADAAGDLAAGAAGDNRPVPRATRELTRRRLAGFAAAGLTLASLEGCGDGAKWHAVDVSGSLPPLSLSLTRSEDGKRVTEADYGGKIVLLYFGYTQCPDECPTTLANTAEILTSLGADARYVRMLFVTVDPYRDTAPVLSAFTRNFAPEMEGLRGTPDALAALARRCRVLYSVTPATKDQPYEVAHSAGVYVFDRWGDARLIVAALDSAKPDIAGTAADLRRLVRETQPRGILARLRQWL